MGCGQKALSPAYEACSATVVQHYCHGVTISALPITVGVFMSVSNRNGCVDLHGNNVGT